MLCKKLPKIGFLGLQGGAQMKGSRILPDQKCVRARDGCNSRLSTYNLRTSRV